MQQTARRGVGHCHMRRPWDRQEALGELGALGALKWTEGLLEALGALAAHYPCNTALVSRPAGPSGTGKGHREQRAQKPRVFRLSISPASSLDHAPDVTPPHWTTPLTRPRPQQPRPRPRGMPRPLFVSHRAARRKGRGLHRKRRAGGGAAAAAAARVPAPCRAAAARDRHRAATSRAPASALPCPTAPRCLPAITAPLRGAPSSGPRRAVSAWARLWTWTRAEGSGVGGVLCGGAVAWGFLGGFSLAGLLVAQRGRAGLLGAALQLPGLGFVFFSFFHLL